MGATRSDLEGPASHLGATRKRFYSLRVAGKRLRRPVSGYELQASAQLLVRRPLKAALRLFASTFEPQRLLELRPGTVQNRECSKVPNSDLCLETRPAADTERRLETPSTERAKRFKLAPSAHGPKTLCRTSIFLDFGLARRDGAPTAPGGLPFCEPTTHGCEPDFQHNSRLCLNPMLDESPLACRIVPASPGTWSERV